MKIQLERMNNGVHFQARNESGASLDIDGSPSVGGENKGMRPMETVLAGLAGCSAMDLVSIIKKQRMILNDCKIDVEAERADGVPSPFTKIHLHYRLFGSLEEEKTRRAVDLAVDSYCSVAVMLEKSAEITHSFEIIRE
ncbi:OsmC family protein [Salinispira pacifica]|uniref:OsmC/Ohr family protein n=1 Tax=Salinispira pacifica TaxID=1307761 RepID=V5WIZ7_9SPIO|nr:OsmC family protein [Salinispira pacifica]AHC15595.1 OsmC/Ohr family protein [Salinispira pacifica]